MQRNKSDFLLTNNDVVVIGTIMNAEIDISTIKHPWEDGACEECEFCHDDMCCVYKLGISNAYCPQIRDCTKYKCKRNINKRNILT